MRASSWRLRGSTPKTGRQCCQGAAKGPSERGQRERARLREGLYAYCFCDCGIGHHGSVRAVGGAAVAELKLLVGNALKTVMDEVGPQFEKASGNTLSVTVGTTAQLKGHIDGGEAFDAVPALDQLAREGKVAGIPRAGSLPAPELAWRSAKAPQNPISAPMMGSSRRC